MAKAFRGHPHQGTVRAALAVLAVADLPCTHARPHRVATAEVTRHTVLPTSSATSRAPFESTATPTGRPRALPSSSTNPVSTSSGSPLGRPSANGTKITL